MSERAISKVIYKSSASATPEVWMDSTTATAAAADILAPKTAMLADGVVTEGTGTGGGGGGVHVYQDENGYIVLDPNGGGDEELVHGLTMAYHMDYNSSSSGKPSVRVSKSSSASTYGATVLTNGSGRYAYDNSEYVSGNPYPIMLPEGCTKLSVTVPSNDFKVTAIWVDTMQAASAGPNIALCVNHDDGDPWNQSIPNGDREINVPTSDGPNGVYINIYSGNGLVTQALLDQVTVTAIVSGGGDVNPVAPEKQINFVDYDGEIRYSYTAAEFAELTELPANPTHDGRVAQGWNWTLSQINAQLAACPGGVVWVGQNYTTSDGKTHIHIVIPVGTPASRRTFYVRYTQSVTYGVSIDWGDGSTPESHSSSGSNLGHTYAATGEYDISVYATSGTVSFVGSSSSSIFGPYENNYISSNIKDIVWGDDVTGIGEHILYYVMSGPKYMSFPNSLICSGEYLFGYNYGLRMVTVPEGTTSLPYRMFRYCYGLHRVVLPGSLSSIGHEAFAYCHGITEMTIPNGVTAIEYNAFTDCRSLTNLEIPASVTSIGDSAFSGCTGMGAYHFYATTPPTLGSSVFSSIPSDCVIYVPSASVNAYKTATNWSAYSSYIQGE